VVPGRSSTVVSLVAVVAVVVASDVAAVGVATTVALVAVADAAAVGGALGDSEVLAHAISMAKGTDATRFIGVLRLHILARSAQQLSCTAGDPAAGHERQGPERPAAGNQQE
jgi:hypothetical protein